MPPRQYFCWKLCLKFNCGCMEYTSTQHVCNANRGITCYNWMITRSTDKDCDEHRIVGLHDGSSSSPEPEPSKADILNDFLLQEMEYQSQSQSEASTPDDDTSSSSSPDQVQGQGKKKVGGYFTSGSYEQAPRRMRDVNPPV